MKTFTGILSFIFILLSYQYSFACTCTDYGVPSCKRFSDADAVFVGKITNITSAAAEKDAVVSSGNLGSISWDSYGLIAVHFKVEKSFRGVDGKTVKAFTYKGTSCDLEVKRGQRWTIFAVKDKETGNLSFGACGGNYRIEDKSDEPTELENISSGKFEPTIVGRVAEDSFGDGIKNLRVNLEGNGTNLSTLTDESGRYKFIVPQFGKYKIKVYVPFSASLLRFYGQRKIDESPAETETVFEYEAEVIPKTCDYESLYPYKIDLKATAEIKWRFSDDTGKTLNMVDVELCRVKPTEEETLKQCSFFDNKNPDSSFSFGGLREGKFVLVVSKYDFPEFDSPYLRYYYPGVRSFSEAQIINLELGQKLELPDFKLPPAMPTQEITGRLFWKDGKPITQADLDEDGVYFQFYNPQRISSPLSMSHFVSPSEMIEDGLKLNEDGSFSFRAFVGMNYIVKFSAHNKKGKKYSKQIEIRIDENVKPLEIVLEEVKKK